MAQLEDLISDFCQVVAESLLIAEEWERTGPNEIVLFVDRISNKENKDIALLTTEAAYSIDETGKQLAHCLESRGIDTKEFRRFLRAVSLWQWQYASSLWDDLELDLEGIALRLQLDAGTKPGTHITNEPPANSTKKKTKHRGRGRPIDANKKQDARIFDAWKSGHYRTIRELAAALGKPEPEVRLAIDRERKERAKDAE